MLDDKKFLEECVQHDFAFIRGIHNSIYYWPQSKREVFARIRQLDKPTVFHTLSASKLHWTRYLAYYRGSIEVNPRFTYMRTQCVWFTTPKL